VLLAAALVVGVGYLVVVRPLTIGQAWAVIGTQLGGDVHFDARPVYEVEFAPDQPGFRFGLLLGNNGPLPMTVRLAVPDEQSATDLDRIVGLRLDRSAATEGSTTMEDTVPVESVEIPAFGQRWVVFEGRWASCDVARTWNVDARQSRQSVRLDAALLGIRHEVSLALPSEQQFGPPPPGVCV
jgi:hypothetical protein